MNTSWLPWWGKIAAKMVLRRLPLSGRTWQGLGLFAPGAMLDPDYAIGVFCRHFTAGAPLPADFRFLELGPGDSLASAAVAWAYGAGGGYLVDAGAYAARDISRYQPLFAQLSALHRAGGAGAPLRDAAMLADCADLDAMLRATGTSYLEHGLESLRRLPAGSIQMIFSQAVLEHVPVQEFAATMQELRRLLAPDGRASHQIDYKDHLAASLHNLRFTTSFWEQPWFARDSGFYTSRLRHSAVMAAIRAAGFQVVLDEPQYWPAIPLARHCLAAEFRNLSDDDLRIRGAWVVLQS